MKIYLNGTATNADLKILNPLWAIEFANEGPFLSREVQFCSKMSIFQGEEDRQATFEDALAIKDACQEHGTPLAGFKSYPGLSHGFSPYIGFRKWKKTVGPMDPQVPQDIAAAASQRLRG